MKIMIAIAMVAALAGCGNSGGGGGGDPNSANLWPGRIDGEWVGSIERSGESLAVIVRITQTELRSGANVRDLTRWSIFSPIQCGNAWQGTEDPELGTHMVSARGDVLRDRVDVSVWSAADAAGLQIRGILDAVGSADATTIDGTWWGDLGVMDCLIDADGDWGAISLARR